MAHDDIPASWARTGDTLTRTIQCADFVEALALTLEIGRLAEKANHHPDISLHDYRKLDITLCSHDAGRTVTDKDLSLARQINGVSEDAIRSTKENLQQRFSA